MWCVVLETSKIYHSCPGPSVADVTNTSSIHHSITVHWTTSEPSFSSYKSIKSTTLYRYINRYIRHECLDCWTSILYSKHLRVVILIDIINWEIDCQPHHRSAIWLFRIFSRRVMLNNFQYDYCTKLKFHCIQSYKDLSS